MKKGQALVVLVVLMGLVVVVLLMAGLVGLVLLMVGLVGFQSLLMLLAGPKGATAYLRQGAAGMNGASLAYH